MEKKSNFTFICKYLVALSLLCFSIIISTDIYASEDGSKSKTYSVKFCDNKGACTTSAYKKLCRKVSPGETITLPEVPAVRNYVGLGWAYKANETTARRKAGKEVTVNKNITYFAVYRKEKTFTVTYVDPYGKTSASFDALNKKLKESAVFTLPSIPDKVGYTPVCWKIEVNDTIKHFSVGTKIKATRNYKFYAHYKRNDDAKLILHYNNGNNYKAINVEYGSGYRLPPMDNPKGYTFMGWGTKPNMFVGQSKSQTFYLAGETIPINGITDLYAVLFKRSEEFDPTAVHLGGPDSPDVSAYKKIIFIGGSRTSRLQRTLIRQNIDYSKKNVCFLGKSGTRLKWLKEEGYPALLDTIKKTSSKDSRPIAVIFNHGANDLFHADEYIAFYKSIASELESKNCKLFFMSVNPGNSVRNAKSNLRLRHEYEVIDFNKKLKQQLSGTYTYIDTFSWLMKTGYSTDSGSGADSGTDDGLHYTTATYKRIYLRCLQCLAGTVRCS